MPAIQYWQKHHMANTRGSVMDALAAMLKPGMMPHRLKTNNVQNTVVIIGT